MEAFLLKILAAAPAVSQVTLDAYAVKAEFSRDPDQQQVAEILQTGCTHVIEV
jgi:penicillin-binding protein 1A